MRDARRASPSRSTAPTDREAGRTGSVTNDWPVRIGGPGVGEGDDQFHGRIDDVYLRIDATA